VDLLRQHVENGRRFAVRDYVEAGDQVSVTLDVTGPEIPNSVALTEIFTFRRGTNVVVQLNDGVDMLALRALWDQDDVG
jgi:hypothetical protein